MIVEIISGLGSFFIVLLLLLLGFSFINYQFEDRSYGGHLLQTYSTMFLQFDTSNYSPGQTFFFVLSTILLSTVLLNMIISVMNDIFNQVQEKGALSDGKERVFLILESMLMKRLFSKICFRRQQGLLNQQIGNPKQYLFIIEEGRKQFEISNMHAIKTALYDLQKEFKHQMSFQSKLKVQQDAMEVKYESQNSKLMERQREFEERIIDRIEDLKEKITVEKFQIPNSGSVPSQNEVPVEIILTSCVDHE